MVWAKTVSKSPLRLDQLIEVEAAPPPSFDGGGFVFELVVELVAVDGGGAAGAPGVAVEGDEADFGGGFVAAASADQDGAVDEGKLVVFLKEDDEAVGEFDAFGLLGLEGVERRDGDLASTACAVGAVFADGGLREGAGRRGSVQTAKAEKLRERIVERSLHFAPPSFCAAGVVGMGGCWGFSLRWDELDARAGAVAVDEDLVGDAADVGFGDGVDLVELAEELAPVAVAGLVFGELVGEAFVVAEAAEQVGAGAGFEALELVVGDVFALEAVDLFVDGGAHLVGRVAGERDGIDGEEAGIFVAGKSAEALGLGGDLLVADESSGRGARCGRWRRCR